MVRPGLLVATLVAIGWLGAPWLFLRYGSLSAVAERHVVLLLLAGVPPLLLYLWALSALRGRRNELAASALALGAASALAFSLPALLPPALRACGGQAVASWTLGLLPVGHAALLALALGARRRSPATGGLPIGCWLAPVVFFLVAVVAVPANPAFWHDRLDQNDSRAILALARIRDCARDFAARNPLAGYPPSLDGCGVAAETRGHVIRYVPAAPDAAGRVHGYRVSAQPREWDCSSRTSYRSDESGELRAELEP